MDMKELLMAVVRKFDDTEMLKKHHCELKEFKSRDFCEYTLYYRVPTPTKNNPDDYDCENIGFVKNVDGCGFTDNGYRNSNMPRYLLDEPEWAEMVYRFSSIQVRLEEIRRQELLKLL